MADLKLARLLETIDAQIESVARGSAGQAVTLRPETGRERLRPTVVTGSPPLSLDLRAGRIGTVLWATGYRPSYDWLHVNAFDRKGRLAHDGGVVAAAGIYALGLNFLRRRKSSFMHGAEDDVRDLSDHLSGFLRDTRRRTARVAAG